MNKTSRIYIKTENTVSLPASGSVNGNIKITPQHIFISAVKRVPLCAMKGSLTVEAALALPLFFMITICLISIMGVYGTVLREMMTLRDSSEAAAMAVSGTEGDSWIELENIVTYKPYYLPSGVSSIYIPVKSKVRAWTGRDGNDSSGSSSSESSNYVYMTEYGSVYHTDPSCTHLDLSISTTSSASVGALKNVYGEHYHACDKCVGSGSANSTVYITQEGDCYHNSAECSGLKRTVKLVSIDEVGDVGQCSRCAASGG